MPTLRTSSRKQQAAKLNHFKNVKQSNKTNNKVNKRSGFKNISIKDDQATKEKEYSRRQHENSKTKNIMWFTFQQI